MRHTITSYLKHFKSRLQTGLKRLGKKQRIRMALLIGLGALSLTLVLWPQKSAPQETGTPPAATAEQPADTPDDSPAMTDSAPTTPATETPSGADSNEAKAVEVPPPGTAIPHALPQETPLPDTQLTTHFAKWEFACDCKPRASASGAQATAPAGADANLNNNCSGFPAEMDTDLLAKLEALRTALGRPVVITSGVRCATRNAEVGGVPDSRHLSGRAADLYCPGISYADVAEVARGLGLWVLEYPEEQYVHVEV